ncbi:S8 family serine peptidase [Sporosarcina sp. P17b]|uniref:S8 family serine peptidase n=1 Tax=Sporosarcina sp. P17b TaxID=2048260 RepID=UPI000C167F5C|nr:S8 family serine peptidase [Sporosarcina sp. P17b]PIC74235.1 hypothetical protein CSV76_07025 [Sporosarcina sp. P17b]
MKKSSLRCLLLVLVFLGLINSEPIHSNAQSPVTELLVEYAEDVRMTFSEEVEMQVETRKRISDEVELWSLTKDADVEALQLQLQEDPTIAYVELNAEREIAADIVDPGLNAQWWISHVRPEMIWSRVAEQRKSISVAVIDSGMDTRHIDLEKRVRTGGYNFYDSSTDVFDVTGHGTKVAGVIAAEYGNGIGVTGIVGPYDVKILPLKVFGEGNKTKTSYIVAAINYAVSRGVDVINLSLGGDLKSDIENNAIQQAIEAGITVVAASGNKAEEGNPLFYPASYDNVISVGSVDQLNQHVKSSNYNNSLTLVAPGTSIYTTSPNHGFTMGEGTSFSSPIVAGAVAMYKSLQPNTTPQQMKNLLKDTAMPLGGFTTPAYFGSGLLNLRALHDRLPPKIVPVERVELNTEAVTLDLSLGYATSEVKALSANKNQLAEFASYEIEPNDTISQATSFLNYYYETMRGRINKTSKDIDFYELVRDEPGMLDVEIYWTKGYSQDGSDNQFLNVDLYDEKKNWVAKADYQELANGRKGLAMKVELQEGYYYMKVHQESSYNERFVEQEYEISSIFIPEYSDVEIPDIILDEVSMKRGDREYFLNKEDNLVEWKSSNPEVAYVDYDGMVVANYPGSATITFYIGNARKILPVYVVDTTIEAKFTISAKVFPYNATDQRIIWSSSDPSIAEVDQNGVVTAKSVGTVFVTARARLGGVAEIATVHVVRNGKGYEFTSDFTNQDVPMDKVFRVTFTQPLSPFKDYSQDIVISRKSNGVGRVKSFTAKVNPLNYNQLLIEPNQFWQEGYHYLTVTKNVQNTNYLSLRKESRIMFYSYYK